MHFEIGQKISKNQSTTEQYTQAAIWCNVNNCHFEEQDNDYIIVENTPSPEPTIQQQVLNLEGLTGLTRPIREIVLSENSGSSEYIKNKAQEIEDLAEQLRG